VASWSCRNLQYIQIWKVATLEKRGRFSDWFLLSLSIEETFTAGIIKWLAFF